MTEKNEVAIPDNPSRLITLDKHSHGIECQHVVDSLKRDLVVLIPNINPEQAEAVVRDVADKLGLGPTLGLHATFASFEGHRHNIGRYFMSVNRREDYQFISPHSEGSSFVNMQLAAFFCYENTTDGGATILMNVDSNSVAWQSLRERVARGRLGSRSLAPHEIVRARGLYRIQLPEDVVREDDQILQERRSEIADLLILDVLAKPRKTRSRILNCELYAYWDSVGSIDFDSASQYTHLLKQCGLLKEPSPDLGLQIDNAADRRLWHSGVNYAQLFKCKIVRKLTAGDLIIQNNLTWTHAATNWSPGSGIRKIAASFA